MVTKLGKKIRNSDFQTDFRFNTTFIIAVIDQQV